MGRSGLYRQRERERQRDRPSLQRRVGLLNTRLSLGEDVGVFRGSDRMWDVEVGEAVFHSQHISGLVWFGFLNNIMMTFDTCAVLLFQEHIAFL